MVKKLENLIDDIYASIDDGKLLPESSIEIIQKGIESSLKRAFRKRDKPSNPLWPSNLGKPDCQLWFMANEAPQEDMLPHTKIKFLIGDILEHITLGLADYAGHEVSHQQARVTLYGHEQDEGMPINSTAGNIDARVDGETIDVKSTSSYSFKKFDGGKLHEDDPFGYYAQIGTYGQGKTEDRSKAPIGGWLAIDKQNGHMTFARADPKYIPDMRARLDEVSTLIKQPDKPPRAFDLVPEGQSGNMKLGLNCSYCPFKRECFKDANDGQGLRAFLYYKGPVFFAEIKKEPNVPEISLDDAK